MEELDGIASYVSLQRPQTWSQLQTFSPGIAIGTEQCRQVRVVRSMYFSRARYIKMDGESWTLDKAITVTRHSGTSETAPAGLPRRCHSRDRRTTPVNLKVAAAANGLWSDQPELRRRSNADRKRADAAAGGTTSPSTRTRDSVQNAVPTNFARARIVAAVFQLCYTCAGHSDHRAKTSFVEACLCFG